MTDQPSSLSDLTPSELAALVELAEAYQRDEVNRRDVLALAGLGGLAGIVGGAGASAGIEGVSSMGSADGDNSKETGNQDGAERSVFAAPGEVQAAIDSRASNGGGLVKLDPTQRYEQPSSPWEVREDVILDFNGAFVYGTGDLNNTNLIHLYPGAQLHSPRIDLYDGGNGYTTSNGYQARVISLDTQLGGSYFAYGTAVRNGVLRAAGGTGVACYMGVNAGGSGSANAHITHLDIELDIGIPKGSDVESSVNTACHIDTAGAGDNGWINGVYVRGHWRYPKTGILQTGANGEVNQQVMNQFHVQMQSSKNANAFWQIKDPTFARRNRWCGAVWDTRRYSDYAWKIDSAFQDPERSYRGCRENAVGTLLPNINPDDVRNQSPNEHYITDINSYQSVVV